VLHHNLLNVYKAPSASSHLNFISSFHFSLDYINLYPMYYHSTYLYCRSLVQSTSYTRGLDHPRRTKWSSSGWPHLLVARLHRRPPGQTLRRWPVGWAARCSTLHQLTSRIVRCFIANYYFLAFGFFMELLSAELGTPIKLVCYQVAPCYLDQVADLG
jgi:hypothetical protein